MSPTNLKVVPVPCPQEIIDLLDALKTDTGQSSNAAVIRLAITELAKARGLKVG